MPRLRLIWFLIVASVGISACTGPVARPPQAAERPFDLEEATIPDLQERMASGRDTARSIAEKYLARIEQIDRAGPALRSVIELNPDALSVADERDRDRKIKGARGPLHGIPILLKDNIATADRMATTAGSLALDGVRAPKDAYLVEGLRDAGAVILGKTNLSEWANFRSTHSTSGWSARGGLTRNPYALDRNPSGSSSGSAVAVAANLAAAAVGTETDGSIVSPANNAAIVGIKPTVGLVSRSGIVPIAASQDTAGPMARTVADAVALLAFITGADPEDPVTRDTAGAVRTALSNYQRLFDAKALEGARIGVVRSKLFGYSPPADRLAEAAIADMKKLGAVIVDPADIPTLGSFDATEFEVLLYEFKDGLNKYLAWLGPASPVHSLKEIIAFNAAHADRELKYFGQEIMEMAEAKGPLTSPDYQRALATNRRQSRELGIDAVMTKFKLDALVAPTFGPAWITDLIVGDTWPLGASSPSTVAAVAGYPHITVPMGFVKGLPVGLSFLGRAWSEPTLIRIAYAYEQATKHRRPPTFAATAEVEQR